MPHVQREIPRFAVYYQVRSTLAVMQGTFYVSCLHAFKSLYRFVLVPDVSCILNSSSIGRICWLNILRRSIVGSAFPTALWTIDFEAIMAWVDLSFTYLLFSSNRGPWKYDAKVFVLSTFIDSFIVEGEIAHCLSSQISFIEYHYFCLVSDISMRSSACSRWFIFRPPILTPGSPVK